MIQFVLLWWTVIVAMFVATLLLMVIGHLFQLNCFACLKILLLEIYIYTHDFFASVLCYEICTIQEISLSFIIVKIPMIYVKFFKQPHIFIMVCFFEKKFIPISQTLRRDWNAQHPKNNKLINNSSFLDHWQCVIISWNHLPIQQFKIKLLSVLVILEWALMFHSRILYYLHENSQKLSYLL
jgi:hypothetical protein